MRDNDIQNILRTLGQIGRTNRQVIIIDNNQIVDGVMIGKETRASVTNGNVEIDEVSYNRVLGCGHIASPNSITAVCDVCERMVCEKCIFVCSRCNIHLCHHCCKIYMDKEIEKILCLTCLWDTKRRDNLSKVFGFFVKTKEDE